ncbi:MAG: hypothetical protein ACKO9I_09765 [Sphaerospermopsis kisseleviana]
MDGQDTELIKIHQSPVPSHQSPVPNIYQFLHPPLGAVSVSPLKP